MFSMQFARPLVASVFALVLIAAASAAPKQKTATHAVQQRSPARKATVPGTNPHMNKRSHPVGAPNTHKHHKWL